MNWNDYLEFHNKVEVTPLHFGTDTVKGLETPQDLVKFNKLHHFALGLSGEGSEVGEVMKKCLYGKRVPFGPEVVDKLLDESGDVLFYLAGIIKTLGLSLEDLMELNKTKLSARYPELLNENIKV